jgi:hypothetical protein
VLVSPEEPHSDRARTIGKRTAQVESSPWQRTVDPAGARKTWRRRSPTSHSGHGRKDVKRGAVSSKLRSESCRVVADTVHGADRSDDTTTTIRIDLNVVPGGHDRARA